MKFIKRTAACLLTAAMALAFLTGCSGVSGTVKPWNGSASQKAIVIKDKGSYDPMNGPTYGDYLPLVLNPISEPQQGAIRSAAIITTVPKSITPHKAGLLGFRTTSPENIRSSPQWPLIPRLPPAS